MHQHPRLPPVTASPARSPQTNPMRSNNPRDQLASHSRHSSESYNPSEQGISMTEGTQVAPSTRDPSPMDRLSLIVQNYFYKSALMIVSGRASLPQAYTARNREPRVNKWFNIEIPETQALVDSTQRWRNAGAVNNRPPKMIIETYLDLQDLTNNQKLVVLDDYGKRWDVETAIKDHLDGYEATDAQVRRHRIVLERWTCELGQPTRSLDENFPLGEMLPKVYKGSIILYRSLFAHLNMLPAYKFYKKTKKPVTGQHLPKLKWRIYDASQQPSTPTIDELAMSLFAGQTQVTESHAWDPVDSPAGQFSIRVSYRTNCDFRIDTSESLFNSQFMAHDEQWFEPSLPRSSVLDVQRLVQKQRPTEMGSVPSDRRDMPGRRKLDEIAEQGPAYGSLSTFHSTAGRIGTSPLSALRAARELHGRSPTESPPHYAPAETRLSPGSSVSLREGAPALPRRTSVSFQPFKTPAFSASVPADHNPPPSPRLGSVNRSSPLAALAEARNPGMSSQTATSPRTSPKPSEAIPITGTAGSPRPAPARFSSSFSHRRNRLSVGGTSSRTEDEHASSGRGSASSSNVQSGPSVDVGSANSLQTDDDNISEFLKMLDQKKDLKSFKTPPSSAGGPGTGGGGGATAARGAGTTTAVALSKYQQLRDSHAALSDSMSSSQLHLQRSSVSSASRQLANVPGMVAGTSAGSISSSSGERISPRTPHTPAIPSRLSSNSIIEYNQGARRPRQHRFSEGEETAAVAEGDEGGRAGNSSPGHGTTNTAGAIPIPTSPRAFHPSYRRSSSAQQHHRERDGVGGRDDRYDVATDLDDILPFALRSQSLGDGEEREPLSLSGILRLQNAAAGPIPTGVPPPPPDLDVEELVGLPAQTAVQNMGRVNTATRSMAYRGRGHGRVSSIAQEELQRAASGSGTSGASSASGSRPGTGRSGSGSETMRAPGRHSFTRPSGIANFEDEELLFDMSEQLEGGGSGGAGSGSGTRSGRMQQW